MAVLHGTWLGESNRNYLFIWGETWRSPDEMVMEERTQIQPHPLSMSIPELGAWLPTLKLKLPEAISSTPVGATGENKATATTNRTRKRSTNQTTTSSISFPSVTEVVGIPSRWTGGVDNLPIPIHSSTPLESLDFANIDLFPWQIEGICLKGNDAIAFLHSLPLNPTPEQGFIGSDLRFWSQVARWSLDLIARCKFLPTLERIPGSGAVAKWKAIIDSAVDTARLEKFGQRMPLGCRFINLFAENTDKERRLHLDYPLAPQSLIQGFLDGAVDVQIRQMVSSLSTGETRLLAALPPVVRQWLHNLTVSANPLAMEALGAERLAGVLKAWTMPLEYQLAGKSLFRTGFELKTPPQGSNTWKLAYFLQATDDVNFRVDAATIWQHPQPSFDYQGRTIEQPQETFLRGLGLASRLFSPIADSLATQSPVDCELTPVQAYEFIKTVAWRLEDSGLGVILPPSLANREGWANKLGLKITAQTPNQNQVTMGLKSLLNFKWELAIGGQTLSQQEFDRLVALNSPLVEINGEWVELRSQDIKTAQSFFANRQQGMNLSLEDALRLSTGDTQTIEKLPVVSFEASGALQELISALTNNQTIATLPPPKNLQGELRPYQARGVAWLLFLERWGLGGCLADDMGLGKSAQFITFLLHLKEADKLENPTLLVCPTSVMGNWEREIKKFAPIFKVWQYHGDKRPKGKKFVEIAEKHDIIITSYTLVPRDLKTLQQVKWQVIALDEAQNIKNPEAKQSQAIRQLQADFRTALTGTPVENRLQELWSILDFLNPGYLGDRQFFQRRFAIPIEKYGDTSSLEQLRSLVQPFILRRLKSDRTIIQDLPEKQEITEFCGLTLAQADLYQQTVETTLTEIEAAEGIQRKGMILALITKLKQICNHPAQYLKQNRIDSSNSGKLQRLEDMLEVIIAEGDRSLIFTQFAEWGKLLQPYLEQQLNREIFFLYGSTKKKDREIMIDRFQNDPQAPPIMILSLKAGGVGLNLTRANHVIHFDRWWNPAVENQATDRVFRIGQTRNVQVHKFVCSGTLEEKIHDTIESKKQLAEQVVGTGEDWLTELDTDQLRNLLVLDRSAIIEEEED